MTVSQERINDWLMQFVNYKRGEAKKIEEVHGPGPISDAKFKSADDCEEFVKEMGGNVSEVLRSAYKCGPQNDNKDLPYSESVYEDGTVIRTIKTTVDELHKKGQLKDYIFKNNKVTYQRS